MEKDIAVRIQKLAVIVLFQNSGDDSSSWGDDSQTWETTRLRAETTLHSKLQNYNFCDALRETAPVLEETTPELGRRLPLRWSRLENFSYLLFVLSWPEGDDSGVSGVDSAMYHKTYSAVISEGVDSETLGVDSPLQFQLFTRSLKSILYLAIYSRT